ncbi:MAG: hypothetical protein IBX70_05975 [Clostridia bacterium]|nr:hypothetical protein [Clostridia bacterium]
MGKGKRFFAIMTMLILSIVFIAIESDPITIAIGLIFLLMVEVFFCELTYHLSLIKDRENHLLMKLENPMSLSGIHIVFGLLMISVSMFAIIRFETRLLYIVITMVLGLFTVLIKKNRVLILTHQFVMIHGIKYSWDAICDVMTEENSGMSKRFNLVIIVTERKGFRIVTCSKKINLTVDEWENYFALEILSSFYKSRVSTM